MTEDHITRTVKLSTHVISVQGDCDTKMASVEDVDKVLESLKKEKIVSDNLNFVASETLDTLCFKLPYCEEHSINFFVRKSTGGKEAVIHLRDTDDYISVWIDLAKILLSKGNIYELMTPMNVPEHDIFTDEIDGLCHHRFIRGLRQGTTCARICPTGEKFCQECKQKVTNRISKPKNTGKGISVIHVSDNMFQDSDGFVIKLIDNSTLEVVAIVDNGKTRPLTKTEIEKALSKGYEYTN